MHIYNTHTKRNGKALTSKVESGVCDIVASGLDLSVTPFVTEKFILKRKDLIAIYVR
jgi:hypothetical protein